MRRKMLLVAEVDVEDDGEMQTKLDTFREAARPYEEWGISLYRAQAEGAETAVFADGRTRLGDVLRDAEAWRR